MTDQSDAVALGDVMILSSSQNSGTATASGSHDAQVPVPEPESHQAVSGSRTNELEVNNSNLNLNCHDSTENAITANIETLVHHWQPQHNELDSAIVSSSLPESTATASGNDEATGTGTEKQMQQLDVLTSSSQRDHPELTPAVDVFRFEPLFGRTPLIEDPNNSILSSEIFSVSVPFNPVNSIPFFAELRQSALYSWVFITFVLTLLVTQIFWSFQNSFLWVLVYMPPLFLFMAIEFTQADWGIFKVLFWSFESWLIWVNLLLMLVFAEIGAYFGHDQTSTSSSSPYQTLLINLTLCTGGCFITTFDAFKRTKLTWRLHMLVLVVMMLSLCSIFVVDQFLHPAFMAHGPICLFYCTDTRQLAMSSARTALIFVCKQTVKFVFGGRTTAVLAFDLTCHLPVVDENDAQCANVDIVKANAPFHNCCCGHSRRRRKTQVSSTDFIVASTGTPIIQETNLANFSELELTRTDVSPPMAVNRHEPEFDPTATAVVESDVEIPSSSDRRRSTMQFQIPQSASRSITRDTGYVPIVTAHLRYTPICCCYSNELTMMMDSLVYKIFLLVCAVFTVFAVVVESNAFSLGKIWLFVPVMILCFFFTFCEFARLDRALLKYLTRKFDFWFMLFSLLAFCFVSLYQTVLSIQSSTCQQLLADRIEELLASICANSVFFVANFFTFIWDAAPFMGRTTKSLFMIIICANSVYQIYINRLIILSHHHPLMLLFQLRYLFRQLLMPGKFVMLQVPIKISVSVD